MSDTARRSELAKLIVVGPTVARIHTWAHERGINYRDVIRVWSAQSAVDGLQGTRGLPHVILGWSEFTDEDRDVIRAYLEITGSVPYDDEGEANVVDPTLALRG